MAGELTVDRLRVVGIACVVTGAALAALGAWDSLTLLISGGTYCFGHTCYTTIVEPVSPIYYVGLVVLGAVALAVGIFLLARRGRPARDKRAQDQ